MPNIWIHDMVWALKRSDVKTSNIIAGYQNMTGYSKAQLYRIAKKYGWDSGRKRRKEKANGK